MRFVERMDMAELGFERAEAAVTGRPDYQFVTPITAFPVLRNQEKYPPDDLLELPRLCGTYYIAIDFAVRNGYKQSRIMVQRNHVQRYGSTMKRGILTYAKACGQPAAQP